MTTFGDFLRKNREERGWTQTELGAKIGINSGAISRIENNTKQLSSSKLQTLSELLEIDLNQVKEIYYGDKFAKEAFKNNCPETVFEVAEDAVKYLKSKSSKQGRLPI